MKRSWILPVWWWVVLLVVLMGVVALTNEVLASGRVYEETEGCDNAVRAGTVLITLDNRFAATENITWMPFCAFGSGPVMVVSASNRDPAHVFGNVLGRETGVVGIAFDERVTGSFLVSFIVAERSGP